MDFRNYVEVLTYHAVNVIVELLLLVAWPFYSLAEYLDRRFLGGD